MISVSPAGITVILLDRGDLAYKFDGETFTHFRPLFAPRARWMRIGAAKKWIEATAPLPVRRMAFEARAQKLGEGGQTPVKQVHANPAPSGERRV